MKNYVSYKIKEGCITNFYIERKIKFKKVENVSGGTGGVFEEFPFTTRAQIMVHLHSNILTKVAFFKDKQIELILDIVPHLKPIQFGHMDFIYMENDYAEEIFFITYGSVKFKAMNGLNFAS